MRKTQLVLICGLSGLAGFALRYSKPHLQRYLYGQGLLPMVITMNRNKLV